MTWRKHNNLSDDSVQTYTKEDVDLSISNAITAKVVDSSSEIDSLNMEDGEIAICKDTGAMYTVSNGVATGISSNSTNNLTITTADISTATAANSSYTYYGSSSGIGYPLFYNYNGTINGYYDTAHYNNRKSDYFDSIVDYLDENTLIDLIKTIIDRGETDDLISSMVNSIIQKRHVSEDFLIEFSDILDMKVVKQYYSSDIKTQRYSRIALLIQTE